MQVPEEDLGTVQRVREYLRARLFATNHDDQITAGGFLSNESTPQSRKDAFSTIRSQLEHTILHGYGSSVLVLGPPGSGKTWIVNEVIRNLNSDPRCEGNFLLVRLNGLVHTDDHLALLGVATQLDLREELGENVTMPFSSALNFLLEALRKGSRGKRSIVFILEGFELFTRHKNQTLLYNLFDTAQANCNPVAVVGLTSCVDVVEMLEKRVKSRFSHRKAHLFFDYSFEDYMKIFNELLTLPKDLTSKRFLKRWKERIEELSQNVRVREVLKELYHNYPSIQKLKLFLIIPVSYLDEGHVLLEPKDLGHSLTRKLDECSKLSLLRSLSILELALVVAMNHISQLQDYEPFNFETVYKEYQKFTQRSHSVKYFSKPVAMKAFEHLMDLELVFPASGGTGSAHHHGNKKTMKEYRPMMLRVCNEQVKEAIHTYPNCPTELSRWGLSLSMRT